jgi:hypothetical protein
MSLILDNYKMKERIEELQRRIDVYEEALKYYASVANWSGVGQGVLGRIKNDYEFVLNDNFKQIAGKRARLALEE